MLLFAKNQAGCASCSLKSTPHFLFGNSWKLKFALFFLAFKNSWKSPAALFLINIFFPVVAVRYYYIYLGVMIPNLLVYSIRSLEQLLASYYYTKSIDNQQTTTTPTTPTCTSLSQVCQQATWMMPSLEVLDQKGAVQSNFAAYSTALHQDPLVVALESPTESATTQNGC